MNGAQPNEFRTFIKSWGSEFVRDGEARFRLWAPGLDRLALRLNGEDLPMAPQEGGWYELLAPGVAPNAEYAFVLPDGLAVPDPASRAQAGDVTFEDFLKVGRTFRQMKGNMPGMPGQLSQKQIDDTLEKFDLHEKIVEAMSPDEKGDPQLVLDDLKNTENQLPRIQRIAKASGCAEKDVALFCAEFEAMRQSTQRITAGEDPDEVNADIGSSNRAQRRAAKKAQKKRR